MSVLALQLFGRFQANLDGKPIEIAGANERALISFLAMRAPSVASKDEIIGLLWSGQESEHGAERLDALFGRLKELFDANFEHLFTGSIANDDLAINEAFVDIDAKNFEALAESGRPEDLEQAGKIYSDFLVGLAIRKSGFESWLTRERRRLASLAIGVFQRLSDYHAEAGNMPGAIDAAERLIILEPLDEVIVQNLMRRHAEAGEQTRAIQIYQDLVRELKVALNVEPTTESQELARLIREGITEFVDHGPAKNKVPSEGQPDIWNMANGAADRPSACRVAIHAGDPDNTALIELAEQLSLEVDRDLNDGLADSIAKKAGLRLIEGALHASNTDLRLEFRFFLHGEGAEKDIPAISHEMVRSFDEISFAMDELRAQVRAAAKALVAE